MYHLELLDLLFVLKCLKDPPDNFDIFNYISYSSGPTRSSTSHKLELKFYRFSSTRHQYFNRVVMLWNAFSPIDLSPSFTTIKKTLQQKFWNTFTKRFNPSNPCTFCCLCPCSQCHTSNINISFACVTLRPSCHRQNYHIHLIYSFHAFCSHLARYSHASGVNNRVFYSSQILVNWRVASSSCQ